MMRILTDRERELTELILPYFDGLELREDAPEEIKKAHQELIKLGKIDIEDL